MSNSEYLPTDSEAPALRKGRRRGDAATARAADTTDRLPPHSIDAEQGVLGCVFLSPHECLAECIERLKAGALTFYDLRHQELYGLIVNMFEQREAIDVITVKNRLEERGKLDQVGGISYLATLPDAVPSAANLSHYLAIVLEKFRLRRMVALFTDAVGRIYSHEGETDGMLEEITEDVCKLTEQETVTRERHIKEIVKANLTKLEEWHYRQGSAQIDGLTTGPEGCYLDKMLAGVADDDMGVIAGRMGSGKTSLALNIVKHVAAKHPWWETTKEFHALAEGETTPRPVMKQHFGLPVAIFSLEMTGESLGMRLIFDEAGVDMAQYRTGFKKEGDDAKLARGAMNLTKSNIWVDDSSGEHISIIAAKARRMARQHGIKLFVLDYIQLVPGTGENRVRELEAVATKIIQLKKQLKVPWIVLAQMNRAIETAERERDPILSDLKDCDAIAAAADWVTFTYKTPYKEVAKEGVDEHGAPTPSDVQIIEAVAAKEKWTWGETPYRVDLVIAKHRDGPVGKVQMVFAKNLCRFVDWHLFKLQHGVEELKAGESKRLKERQDTSDLDL